MESLNWLLPLAVLLAAVYVLGFALFVAVSLRPPRVPVYLSPTSLRMPQEDVTFTTDDGIKLRAWWVDQPDSDAVAILCHGYVMNRCEWLPTALDLHELGLSCLLFDFRAHGGSGGKKTHLAVREWRDVQAAVRYARSRKPGARIVLIGSSMGAAACALALAQDRALADAVVLDSAYSRLDRSMVAWCRLLGGKTLAFLARPFLALSGVFLGRHARTVDVAQALAENGGTPTLILHGDRDRLAAPDEAHRNRAALNGSGELVWFEGCGHSEGRLMQPERYRQVLARFLIEHGMGAERKSEPRPDPARP